MFTGYSVVARRAHAEERQRWIIEDKRRKERPWRGRLSCFRHGGPWRGVLWTAVNRGQVRRCDGCASSHLQPLPMGVKRSPMGVIPGAPSLVTSSSSLIPMPDGLATRWPAAPLVLASASETRARILRDAGVAFVGDP